jgi:hypothetical protein
MTRVSLIAAAAALGLLAGCGQDAPAPVNVTKVETDNAAVVVPESNANAPLSNDAGAIAAPALNLAPDGLSVVLESGSARHANFGMARDTVVPMISAALGEPTGESRNLECGQGPMELVQFRDGLTMEFMGGKFVGWDLDGRAKTALATAAGIGIGSTLKQVRDAMTVTVENSTLGDEFRAGDLGGLLTSLEPDATITHLWAGSTCQFR